MKDSEVNEVVVDEKNKIITAPIYNVLHFYNIVGRNYIL
jgi:enhancing lycopene biosynthesis protein 2